MPTTTTKYFFQPTVQGNPISTYDHEVVTETAQFNLKERNIFGSSRIGSKQDSLNVLTASISQNYKLIAGRKFYEFTNHLGNVLTVFTDLKIPQDTDNNNVVDNYKIGITRTADYSPFGVELDGRTLTYSIPVVTNGTPTVIYQHKFDDSPSMHPYTGTPTNLDPNLTNVSWTNSLNTWTNFTGHTGRAIAISNTVQDTARLYLNLSVTNGFLLDVTSYSFRHRSSPTGYANYNLYINNVFVGSGAIFVSSSNSLQTTGTVNVANAIAGLSGSVTVRLDLYNRVGPLTQGTFRMDDFVLNGYTTATENWSPAGYRYGFQNQEKDDEVKGSGNSYDFGARMYDSRVGRWWSVDPFFSKNPSFSPYVVSSNTPIQAVDFQGYYTIFVNGYTGGGAVPYKPYWQGAGRSNMKNRDKNEFINAAHNYFGDGIGRYVNGSGDNIFSMACTRQAYGRKIGKSLAIEIKNAIKNGEDISEINFVTHSMGAATAEGIIEVFMQDPILSKFVENGQIVHFSPADADMIKISKNSQHLDRTQINYTGDITLTSKADIKSEDEFGGYLIEGVKKIGIVSADVNVLHPFIKDKINYDFHDDTKTYKEAWNAVRYVNLALRNKKNWSDTVRMSSFDILNPPKDLGIIDFLKGAGFFDE
ncbi:MAG: hypothetical protein RL264_435 [Bacteroidota bacterium]|jgi:RHS repeat-associated protein